MVPSPDVWFAKRLLKYDIFLNKGWEFSNIPAQQTDLEQETVWKSDTQVGETWIS